MFASTNPQFTITPVEMDTKVAHELIITDLSALALPAPPNQYFRYARHNTAHAASLLDLANYNGMFVTSIITEMSPAEAIRPLDNIFHCYVDGCVRQLDCDAIARFHRFNSHGDVAYQAYLKDGNGSIDESTKYGVDNDNFTMMFDVYCSIPMGYARRLLVQSIMQSHRDMHDGVFYIVEPSAVLDCHRMCVRIDENFPEDEYDGDDGCPHCGNRNCTGSDCQQ